MIIVLDMISMFCYCFTKLADISVSEESPRQTLFLYLKE